MLQFKSQEGIFQSLYIMQNSSIQLCKYIIFNVKTNKQPNEFVSFYFSEIHFEETKPKVGKYIQLYLWKEEQ